MNIKNKYAVYPPSGLQGLKKFATLEEAESFAASFATDVVIYKAVRAYEKLLIIKDVE